MAKKKEEEFTLLSVNIDRPLYFALLEICLAEKKTLDELVNECMRKYAEGILNGTIKPMTKARKKRIKKEIMYRDQRVNN